MEAGMVTAGANGMSPNYAGQGLASILATMNRNIAGRSAAQAQAAKDLAGSQLSLTKMDMDSTLADEANRRNDIRYAMGLTREDMRDHATELNNYIGHRITLQGVEESAAARRDAAQARIESQQTMKSIYENPVTLQQRAVLDSLNKKYPNDPTKALQEYYNTTPQGKKVDLEAQKTLMNDPEYSRQYATYNNLNSSDAQKATAVRIMRERAQRLQVDENLAVPGNSLAFPTGSPYEIP